MSGRDYNLTRNQKLRQQFTAGPDPKSRVDEADGAARKGVGGKESFVLQSQIFGKSFAWIFALLFGRREFVNADSSRNRLVLISWMYDVVERI
jgi:hypothetical protein